MRLTFHGKPCRRGHDGERYLISGACVDCRKDREDRRAPRPSLGMAVQQVLETYDEEGFSDDLIAALGDLERAYKRSHYANKQRIGT